MKIANDKSGGHRHQPSASRRSFRIALLVAYLYDELLSAAATAARTIRCIRHLFGRWRDVGSMLEM